MLSAVDVYRQNAPLPNLAYLQAIQVRIRIQQLNAGQAAPGAFAEIAAWRLAADSFDLPPFISSYIQFTVIRVCLLERRFEQVDAYFQTLNHIAEVSGQPGLWAEIYLMQALLMQAQDRSADATAAFAQSLTYSEPQGYMRLYLNEGKVAERLLRAYAAPSAYTARLLEAFEDQHRIEVKRSDPYGLIDPLSERELEVLRLMAAGLTNAEISSRLYITLRTVKFHTGNILGKLGATNRTEAVTRARAMNLILE
jgi:LuxR family maltose regulon positive regulatory protein